MVYNKRNEKIDTFEGKKIKKEKRKKKRKKKRDGGSDRRISVENEGWRKTAAWSVTSYKDWPEESVGKTDSNRKGSEQQSFM